MRQAFAAAGAMRSIDESGEVSKVYVLNRAALGRVGLPRLVGEIAELFDGGCSIAEALLAAQISDAKCRAVVRKLTTLGVLQPDSVDSAANGGGTAMSTAPSVPPVLAHAEAFTQLEHDFFERPVGPIDECDLPFESVGERVRSSLSLFVARLRRP